MKCNSSLKPLFALATLVSAAIAQAGDQPLVSGTTPMPKLSPDEIAHITKPEENSAGIQVGPKCYASYLIQKGGPKEVRDGDRVPYKVLVTNTGDCPLTDLTITDIFPQYSYLTHSYPAPDFVEGNRQAFWHLRFLPPQATVELNLEFEVKGCLKPQPITNVGCVWSPMIGQQVCAGVNTFVDIDHPKK